MKAKKDNEEYGNMKINQDVEKVLISEEEIEKRCVELAEQIQQDYENEGTVPIIVGLLRGSVPFMAELIKRLCNYHHGEYSALFLVALSYGVQQPRKAESQP